MYLYDANCAVGPWPTAQPLYETVDELLVEMERLGIDRALVSHTTARTFDPPQGNRRLMQEIAGHAQLEPCWTLLPPSTGEMGTVDELMGEMAGADVRAVRLYPGEHTFSLDEWQCGELWAALAARRYLVLIDLAQTDWTTIEQICRTHTGLSLLVTWTGYRQLRPLFALLERCPNLYCDLSNYSTYLGVEETLARFGSGRLLFGTGLPTADPGGPIARLCYTDAPAADLEAMGHGNLERLLAQVQLEGAGA
ncbi:MAG: amidohydrolase family protein [Anaerolineae bacterium]